MNSSAKDDPFVVSRAFGVKTGKSVRLAIDSLIKEFQRFDEERQQWEHERSSLFSKVEQLERECKLQEEIKSDFQKRNRILEYAIKQMQAQMNGQAPPSQKHPKQKIHQNSHNHNPPNQPEASTLANGPPKIHKAHTLPSSMYRRNQTSPGKQKLQQYLKDLGYTPHEEKDEYKFNNYVPPMNKLPSITVSPPPSSPPISPMSNSSLTVVKKQKQQQQAYQKPKLDDIFKKNQEPRPPKSELGPPIELKQEAESNTNLSALEHEASPVQKASNDIDVVLGLTPETLDLNASTVGTSTTIPIKPFKPRLALRSHLDGVRAISFHSKQPVVFSGSEDGTAKIWNLTKAIHVKSGQSRQKSLEPVCTYRGHRGMVTSVLMDDQREVCFTAGVDHKIIVWNMPDLHDDPYRPHGRNMGLKNRILEGHMDAVWDLSLHPNLALLCSASADATVTLWKIDDTKKAKVQSFIFRPDDIAHVPTSVAFQLSDPTRILVGYTSGYLVQFDMESSKLICSMADAETGKGSYCGNSSINSIASHNEHPLMFAACADKRLRFYDTNKGECIHTMRAHTDSVSSVTLVPTGKHIVTTSHDSSVRFWDIVNRKICADLSAHQTHRRKHDEGIHCVSHHPSLPLLATGGGDSVVRIYNQ